MLAGCGGSATDKGEAINWLTEVQQGGESRILPPVIALNCPVGNAFACDRVIFHFSMRLPAERLEAWVAGRPVRDLRTAPYGGRGGRRGVRGLVWTGFVQPAGLSEPGGPLELHAPRPNYWAGVPSVRARVRVVAELGQGETVSELFPSVLLLAGYG
ncbi:MAG TPA: hypothetical protein VG518_04135 [Solirubrobacterales bacterium]|nr:hypothetical protein [Solirubrobacterales bacterium]